MPAGVNLKKVKVEDDKIVQVEVTTPREILLHAKSVGTTSLMIWDKSGQVTVMDIGVLGNTVVMDATALQGKLKQMLPNEKGIVVGTAGKSLVLSGTVTDAVKVDKAMTLAEAYAGKDNKVINMLQVGAPQQVMLEVKMAEISKNLLDQLGVNFAGGRVNGGVAYDILSGFSIGAAGKLTFNHGGVNGTTVTIDADKKDTIIKVLAEPNIIAISGQEGSFLAGGKFYIPVPQSGIAAGAVTLEEKDFGVGLRFTPTVLEGGLINLRVAPEVTELATNTITSNIGGQQTISPTLTTRRVSTTVQLHDGQSFAIAGLLKNDITEDVKRFPILGEIPILGALFRSSSFKNNKTELLFVVTPRLVKPLPANYVLPTDNFTPPSRTEFFLEGKLEGKPAESAAAPQASPDGAATPAPAEPSANDGFEMK
jgi:pilus assembly protein CpaC